MDDNTDTVIYSFNKMINLLLSCNPNTIELLGLSPDNYLYLNDIGQMLLDNKRLFLSKRAIQSFGGYADAQLRRLQNALARDTFPQSEKEQELLMDIRSGKYQTDEGTFSDSFYDMMREYEKKLEFASKHTQLPDESDFKSVQEL